MNLKTKLITSKLGLSILKKYAKYKQKTIIISLKDNTILIQKNGSIIITLPSTTNEYIRGHRAKFPLIYDYDSYGIDREELNKVLNKFI